MNIKKILSSGICISLVGLLQGCNMPFQKAEIPFQWFMNNKEASVEVPDVTISSINTDVNPADIEVIQKNINDKLWKSISDKDICRDNINNRQALMNPIKDLFEEQYYTDLITNKSDNIIQKIANKIYSTAYSNFYSANIIKIKILPDSKITTIELVTVDDDMEFKTSLINVYFNENYKITKVDSISDEVSAKNTTNPIGENSLLNINTNNDFLSKLNKLFDDIRNEKLYQENNNTKEVKLNSLYKKNTIENFDIATFKKLFNDGRGSYKNYEITEIEHSDENAEALSIYTISFVNGESIYSYDITYNRAINSIVGVKNVTE